MKLKYLLSAALISLSAPVFAQSWTVDSIAMGAGYTNDVFYGLGQSTTAFQPGDDWDIAFQTTRFGEPQFNAAVRANHAKRGVEVYPLTGISATASWATLSAADTVGKTAASMALINNDTSWGAGAMYQNRNVSDPFSYGWGSYTMSDHSVTGDLIYLLKVGADHYKLWIQKYISVPTDSVGFRFKIAKFDGSNEQTVRIYREAGYANRLFAYYNIASNTVLNREPVRASWDLLFTQYRQLIPYGPGVFAPYNLTDVLTNLGTEVAHVRNLIPDLVNFADVNDPNYFKKFTRTTKTDEIGSDWKTYVNPGPNGYYKITDSASYIIKSTIQANSATNNYYQLQFLRFDGGGATGQGKIVFRKRTFATVGINNVAAQSVAAFAVTPNPAVNDATVMLDSKVSGSAQLIVTDMAGRMVQNSTLNLSTGMNAYKINSAAWPAGIYNVQVAGKDWTVSSRVAVAH